MLQDDIDREELAKDAKNLTQWLNIAENDAIFRYKMLILIDSFKNEYTRNHADQNKGLLLDKFKILDELTKYIE